MSTDDPTGQPPIIVFWRPACGFCARLLYGLDRSDLAYRRVNIWEDDEARAFVRSVANGHETVPTVVIGDRALVNPSAAEVVAAANDVSGAQRSG